MTEPQNKIGVFMTPTLENFIETIDSDEITAPHTHIATPDPSPLEALFYPE